MLSLALAGAPPVLVPVPLVVLVIDFGRSRSAVSTGSVQRGKARLIGDYVVYVELVGDGRRGAAESDHATNTTLGRVNGVFSIAGLVD